MDGPSLKVRHRYRPKRVGEMVAEDLRREIITREIKDELPREEVLLERFDVSRPSLREALRILETDGLIEVRRGRVGGAAVRLPTADGAAYHMGLVLQSSKAKLSDVAEARLYIEPACAQMAAEHPEHEVIAAELVALIDQNEDLLDATSTEFTESAQQFHVAITNLCGNLTMKLLSGSLEAVWNIQEQNWAEEAETEGNYPETSLRRDVFKAHRAIARRIKAGEAEGAQRAMRKHLEHSQPFVNLRDQPVEVVWARR